MATRETQLKVNVAVTSSQLNKLQGQIKELEKSFEQVSKAADKASVAIDKATKSRPGTPGGIPGGNTPGGGDGGSGGGSGGGRGRDHDSAMPRWVNRGIGRGKSFAGQVVSGTVYGSAATLGIAGIAGTIFAALSSAKEYTIAMDDLSKRIGTVAVESKTLGDSFKGQMAGLGLLPREIAALTKEYIGLAGAMGGVNAVEKAIKVSGQFARGFGLEPSSITRSFAEAKRTGAIPDLPSVGVQVITDKGFVSSAAPDSDGTRIFAAHIAQAIEQGKMSGREEELIRSIQSLVNVQSQTLLRPTNTLETIKLLTTMNAFGNSAGLPGLVGSAGAGLLSQLHQGIQHPGGGQYGQYLMYRMLGGGDYFDYLMKREKGISNIGEVMRGMKDQFGGMPANQQHWVMSQMLGISMHQAKGFKEAYSTVGAHNVGRFSEAIEEATQGRELDLRKLPSLSKIFALKESGRASREELKEILTGPGLRMDEKEADILSSKGAQAAWAHVLRTAFQEGPGDRLRNTLEKVQTTFEEMGEKILNGIIRLVDLSEGLYKKFVGDLPPKPEDKRIGTTTIGNGSFLDRIGRVESGGKYFIPNATGSGAYGKYQIMPGTWRRFAPAAGIQPFSAMTPDNQEKVAAYMQEYYSKRYNGDERLMALAWYAGEGNADKLMRGDVSEYDLYRPRYHKGKAYDSWGQYMKKVTGKDWDLKNQESRPAQIMRPIPKPSEGGNSGGGGKQEQNLDLSIYLDGKQVHTATYKNTGNGNTTRNLFFDDLG